MRVHEEYKLNSSNLGEYTLAGSYEGKADLDMNSGAICVSKKNKLLCRVECFKRGQEVQICINTFTED